MKVVRGAPPSYRDEMDKLNVRKSVRRDLDRGFSVAIDSRWDDSLNALVFTVVTPYGEKSQMTLTNTDVPRRISNMCPVVQDPTLLTRDPSTPSQSINLYLNTVKSIRNLKIKDNLTILNKIQNLTTTNLTKTCFS